MVPQNRAASSQPSTKIALNGREIGNRVGIFQCNIPDSSGQYLDLYIGIYPPQQGKINQFT
jgi:hypothetical protein